jgi:hypothetical protein
MKIFKTREIGNFFTTRLICWTLLYQILERETKVFLDLSQQQGQASRPIHSAVRQQELWAGGSVRPLHLSFNV